MSASIFALKSSLIRRVKMGKWFINLCRV
jgi:hypothetical protein